MDNFNGFPATYQSVAQPAMYYQPTQTTPVYSPRNWQQYYQPSSFSYQQPITQNQNNVSMIWVQGESGAKSYVLPNNTTVPLWDSETQTIYIKTVDQNGKPSMTILDYVERTEGTDKPEVVLPEYATKEQIDSLSNQFVGISDKLNSMKEFVTKDQLDELNNHIKDLGGQIEEIENRITSFGKPQSSNNNRRGNK